MSIDEVLAEIGSVDRADQIPNVLGHLASAYGMKTMAYLGTGSLDRSLPRREPYLAVTYSAEWIERYRTMGYLKIDPVIQVGLKRLLPIDWDDFALESAALRQFFGEAAGKECPFPCTVIGAIGPCFLFPLT